MRQKNKGSVVVIAVLIVSVVSLAFSLTAMKLMGHKEAPPTFVPTPVAQADVEKMIDEKFGSYQPSGGVVYKLQNSITSGQSTINLSSFKEPVSNLKYTMTLLNSTYGFGTIEPRNPTRSEFIKFTGITQNTDGTATLIGVTRGLPRSNAVTGGCTASTTLQLSHGGQSDFVLSNSPCERAEYAMKAFDETITGSWTVPVPTAGGNPTTKTYVDALVNGGAVSYNQVVAVGTAGETVSAGQAIYLKQSDARWYKAGVTIAEASSTVIGIAQGAGTSGNPVTGGVLLSGLDSNQSGLTSGVNYFIGPTAGTIGTATSTRPIGRARTSTSIYVMPDFARPLISNPTTFDGLVTFLGSTTTFSNTASSSIVMTATSSLKVGSFPVWQVGKNMQLFTGAGTSTFQVPAGISKVCVEVVGGGGSGGGASSATAAGSGGGAGAYVRGCPDVTGTSSIQVFVGGGGAGAAGNNHVGLVGTWSTFGTNGFYMTALPGGPGAISGVGGLGGATTTTVYFNTPGGDGGSSITATGYSDSSRFASGGVSFFGGYSATSLACAYGAGAPGQNSDGTATKAGCPGVVIVTW